MTANSKGDGRNPRQLKAMLQRAARAEHEPTRTYQEPFVFVAYAHADQAVVRHLVGELRDAGLSVRWDQDIRVGESFRERIGVFLNEAQAVVVVWSPASVHAKFVIDEATAAERLGKLVTLRVPGLAAHEIPLGFQQYRCESIFDRALILQSIADLAASGPQVASTWKPLSRVTQSG